MAFGELAQVPLFHELASSERILVAGCGGGFDVYCGVPLFLALRSLGHEVFLANLCFSDPHVPGADAVTPELTRIDHETTRPSAYFPEHHLAAWLKAQGLPSSVYCFDRTGAVPLRAAYQALCERLELDAILVVDGGTDSLMRGDEAGLGTPHEDILTLVALDGLSPKRYLACLGFGVDAFHGVCHANFLENAAELAQQGAFLGTFSLLPQLDEAKAYLDLVRFATEQDPAHASIVNTSVAAAVAGHYGDHHSTDRTAGSTLFINPLMSTYWGFALQPVIDRVLYRELLRSTQTFSEVLRYVEAFRKSLPARRAREPIPV